MKKIKSVRFFYFLCALVRAADGVAGLRLARRAEKSPSTTEAVTRQRGGGGGSPRVVDRGHVIPCCCC